MGIRYTILGLLHYEDLHGYRIKEHIENNFGHMWSINYGQIYQNLKRLEEEGLVRMAEVAPSQNGGPQKKLYSITDEGRSEFARWLAASPDRNMLLRDPFLTRFVFFDFGEPEDALRLIDEQIELYEKQLEHRRQNIPKWKRFSDYVRLTSQLGMEFNEMYLDWLKRARRQVERSAKVDRRAGARPAAD